MTDMSTGGSAFPGPSFTRSGMANGHSMGMTLRDWFAGQALGQTIQNVTAPEGDWSYLEAARCAYAMADAMIAAREVQP